jgi:hypothetical protein
MQQEARHGRCVPCSMRQDTGGACHAAKGKTREARAWLLVLARVLAIARSRILSLCSFCTTPAQLAARPIPPVSPGEPAQDQRAGRHHAARNANIG